VRVRACVCVCVRARMRACGLTQNPDIVILYSNPGVVCYREV
jgi:hypothetical protein